MAESDETRYRPNERANVSVFMGVSFRELLSIDTKRQGGERGEYVTTV